MKVRLRYLGFLGFLGLLGLTGNLAFYGFFNFFGFWALSRQKRDEMLISNAARAGLNAFKVSLISLALAIAILSVFKTLEAAMISIALVFTAQLLTFIISFNYYEKRGNL
jgi:hypothetical protein